MSPRGGSRAAAIMSLIQAGKLDGLDPYAYIRDALERPPRQPASEIGEFPPHRLPSIASAWTLHPSSRRVRRTPSAASLARPVQAQAGGDHGRQRHFQRLQAAIDLARDFGPVADDFDLAGEGGLRQVGQGGGHLAALVGVVDGPLARNDQAGLAAYASAKAKLCAAWASSSYFFTVQMTNFLI